MPKPRVSEPVQVYLDQPDQDRLRRLAGQLGTTKSDVLRRGLGALERELTDPAAHPALRLIGIADGGADDRAFDSGAEHDRALAETEERSWPARTQDEGGRRGT